MPLKQIWLVLAFSLFGYVCLLFPSQTFAAPVVSNVSGTVSNGNAIAIQGSGFGASGPHIILFDDFEKGAVGNAISTVQNSAQVGNWSRSTANGVTTYTDQWAHGGSKAMTTDWSVSPGEPMSQVYLDFSNTTELYYSFWAMVPIGKNIPGDGNPAGPNWKLTWILGSGGFPDMDYISLVVLQNTFNNREIGGLGYDDWTQLNGYRRFPTSQRGENWYWSTNDWVKGQWKRFEVYQKGGETDGAATLTELTSSGRVNRLNGSNTYTLLSGHYWAHMTMPGYGRGLTPNGVTVYDDVYFATGPGARARVEIGNAPTYNGSNNLSIATATSWNDTSVQVTIRLGSFQSGTQAYLYVIDAQGNVNSQGYPITIGSGGSTIVAPINLRIVNQ